MHPLAARVSAVIAAYFLKATEIYGRTFPMPTVTYDLKGRTAGQAWFSRNLIRVNAHLLNAYTDDMLAQTVPHEVAHLICDHVYPYARKRHHGPEWRSVMRRIGLPPDRCHTYKTVPARIVPKFRYICSCRKLKFLAMAEASRAARQVACQVKKHFRLA